MSDRPILFSAPMILALLAGTKTQTRRVSAKQDWPEAIVRSHPRQKSGVPYAVGDRLYVREAWRCNGWATDLATVMYRASEGDGYTAMTEQYPVAGKRPMRVTVAWRPGIHMPRWASRLTLTVTDVRVQRLQEISEADAEAEGVGNAPPARTAIVQYHGLWDHLNADRGFGWDTNPWVVAVSFTVQLGNIDARAA